MVCLAARIYKNRAREENLLLALSTSEGRQRIASTAGGFTAFIDKIFGWVHNNAVCCRGFPALDSKQRSVTP